MATHNKTGLAFRRLGEYMECDSDVIRKVLALQRQLSAQGRKKLLGALLLEEGAITSEALETAISSQRLDRLLRCPIFNGISLDELIKIRDFVSEKSMPAGKELITQDDSGDCFYVLVEGSALVYRKGDYGEEIFLGNIESGECIGETGYFTEGGRSASVRTLEDSQLLKIDYTVLEKIFDVAPTLTKNFLGLVSRRLRQTDLRFMDMALKSRVAERSLENLSRFLDISEILTLQAGIEGLIERIVTMASNVMNAERASLFLVDNSPVYLST
ncbi:MAG: cyclic nucleotide-binding domain-containing protein, partial [Thermodesulfobacteriota bacterium]|nr:cyclic nucleotide-binding domain-containing protein [Thermodesulfobacteriota bacterium]